MVYSQLGRGTQCVVKRKKRANLHTKTLQNSEAEKGEARYSKGQFILSLSCSLALVSKTI